MGAYAALVRKDLQIFFGDRRAVILTFAVPIAIASFFGAIFSGAGGGGTSEAAKIPVMVVNDDQSGISKAIVAGLEKDSALKVAVASMDQARSAVQKGTTAVAVVIPPGFGEAAGRAFLAGAERPEIGVLFDPSRSAEVSMVRGMLTGHDGGGRPGDVQWSAGTCAR
jgi:ABC-2 type transport system permease protein